MLFLLTNLRFQHYAIFQTAERNQKTPSPGLYPCWVPHTAGWGRSAQGRDRKACSTGTSLPAALERQRISLFINPRQ